MSAHLPDPETAPALFDNVLGRRVSAYIIDLVLLALIAAAVMAVSAVAGFLTFGLAWMLIPVSMVVAIVLYYAATLGSPRRATVGMQTMDLVLTHTRNTPLNGWVAFLHPLLFWATFWISWPVSLVMPLLTPRRQMLHDLVLGTLIVRRSPMVQHWRAQAAGA